MHQLHQPQFYRVEVGIIMQIRINSLGISKGSPLTARCHCLVRGVLDSPSHTAIMSREIKHSELPSQPGCGSSLTQQQ